MCVSIYDSLPLKYASCTLDGHRRVPSRPALLPTFLLLIIIPSLFSPINHKVYNSPRFPSWRRLRQRGRWMERPGRATPRKSSLFSHRQNKAVYQSLSFGAGLEDGVKEGREVGGREGWRETEEGNLRKVKRRREREG